MAVKQVPINDELNALLEAQAKANKRSKTKELENILEQALNTSD